MRNIRCGEQNKVEWRLIKNGWNGKINDVQRKRITENHARKTAIDERLRNCDALKVLRPWRL